MKSNMSDKIKDHIDAFHGYGVFLPTRIIDLTGQINSDSSTQFLKNLHILESISVDPIFIHIDSEGGELSHAKKIYYAIRRSKCPITSIVTGEASSCASLIFQAAKTRIMTEGSYIMLHIGTEGGHDHPKNKKIWDDKNRRDGDWMIDVYLKNIRNKKKGYKKSILLDKLDFDFILEDKDAVNFGLADKVSR